MSYLAGQPGIEKAKELSSFYEDLYKISELGGLVGTRPVSALTKNLFLFQIDRVDTPFPNQQPITTPIDLLTVQSIQFPTLDVQSGTRADGMSGRIFNYNMGSIRFGELSLSVVRDITYQYDYVCHNLVYAFARTGVKVDGTLRKFQFATNVELFQIRFRGMSFKSIQEPALDKANSNLYVFTVTANVDMWYERPVP